MLKSNKKGQSLTFFENFKKWPVFIYLVVFALYGNTLFNKYALDDEFVIKNNKQIHKGIKSIPEIFTTQYFQSKDLNFGYRPVTKAVYAIEYQIFGENPVVSHFINIVLFAVTCILILKLLIKILLPKTGPLFIFITMLFWIFHPIHTEVVASLKNREEILYLIFCLLSLLLFIRFFEAQKWYHVVPAIALYILAYLTKQSAIAFAALIPLVFWFKYLKLDSLANMLKNNYKIILSVIVLFLVTVVLYKIPSWFFPADKIGLLSFENPLHQDHSKISKLALSAYAMLLNLKLLIFPHPLVFYYGQFTIPEVKITDFLVILSIIIHAFFVFLIGNLSKVRSVFAFGLLFYLFGILPFSNYFMEINGIVAERFLYAPSFGFAICITYLIFYFAKVNLSASSWINFKKPVKYFLLFVIIAYSIKTIARNSSWKDSITLYSNDIHYLENSVKANDILAQEKMDKLMVEISKKKSALNNKNTVDSIVLLYERALKLYPENPKALNNLANIYNNFYHKPENALTCLLKAYEYKKHSYEVNFNLAQCYEGLKMDTMAAKYYKNTVSIDPKQYQAWQNLIMLYYRISMPDSAKQTCERMLTKDTLTEIPYVGLGYYYIMHKDTLSAIRNWEIAVKRNPQNYERIMSLGKYFKLHNDSVKSQYYFQKAKKIKRTN